MGALKGKGGASVVIKCDRSLRNPVCEVVYFAQLCF